MGSARTSVESRQRSGIRPTGADLLWFPVNFVLFVVGLALLWNSGAVWETLLLWACYSIPWIVLAAGTDHVLARWRRRREGVEARKARLPECAWLSAVFFSAGMLAVLSSRSGDIRSDRWTFVVVVLAVLAIVLTLRVLRHRREAARRRQEVDDLERLF